MKGAVRTGLLPEHDGVAVPVLGPFRVTMLARERIEAAGNRVTGVSSPGEHPLFEIALARPLGASLALVFISSGAEQWRALRLSDEPAYPDEWSGEALAWWERGEWVPCPACGASLVWYEAAYVPGYRVCSAAPFHHALLAEDGRSARSVRRS